MNRRKLDKTMPMVFLSGEAPRPRRESAHAHCTHEATKAARARCRRLRGQWIEGAPVVFGKLYLTLGERLDDVPAGRRWRCYDSEGNEFTLLESELELV
jgi:hypothetical protein